MDLLRTALDISHRKAIDEKEIWREKKGINTKIWKHKNMSEVEKIERFEMNLGRMMQKMIKVMSLK